MPPLVCRLFSLPSTPSQTSLTNHTHPESKDIPSNQDTKDNQDSLVSLTKETSTSWSNDVDAGPPQIIQVIQLFTVTKALIYSEIYQEMPQGPSCIARKF